MIRIRRRVGHPRRYVVIAMAVGLAAAACSSSAAGPWRPATATNASCGGVTVDAADQRWTRDPTETNPGLHGWQKRADGSGVIITGEFRISADQPPHPARPSRGEFRTDSGETIRLVSGLLTECLVTIERRPMRPPGVSGSAP